MGQIELGLNLRKPGNYGFFCPLSRLHLTRSNPVGSVSSDRITSQILRGLKTKVLIDPAGVIDLETGTVKESNQEVKENGKEEKGQMQVDAADTKEEVKKEKAATKKGKKAETENTEEAATDKE